MKTATLKEIDAAYSSLTTGSSVSTNLLEQKIRNWIDMIRRAGGKEPEFIANMVERKLNNCEYTWQFVEVYIFVKGFQLGDLLPA